MFKILNNKKVLIFSGIWTFIMFILVMLIIDPMIDGENGLKVILLQVSFSKEIGINIIKDFGANGVINFNSYIFIDYLYAIGYSTFFASLLSILIHKLKQEDNIKYTWVIYLAFFAGLCDWIENSIEIFFINNTTEFPNSLFFIHSIIASLKWLSLPIILWNILILHLTYRGTKG